MATRNFGAPIRRNEDARLLSGQALFVDDVELPGMVYAAFLRSNVAHAAIRSIDVTAARAREGVVAVYTAEDLGDYWAPGPLLVPPPPIAGIIFNQRTQVPLAKDKVRHVGEPLAVVLAQSRYLAEDALADIVVELDPLPAVVDLEKALTMPPRAVHDDVRGNVAAHVRQSRGNYAAARARAEHIISRRFLYDHGASSPIETRGIVANWDARANQLTVWDTTQAPVFLRNGLAAMLGLSERQVRVIAPFVGGGFGPKIMLFYPEEVVIPWAAMKLNRPVKWIEDRLEHFFATTQERGQTHDAEIALTRDGRILGIKDVFLHDTGAYNPYGLDGADQQPMHAARALCDPELRQHLHGDLHQQADRHALSRRRPPARRVRDGAAARHRRARAWHRPRRNPPAQFHPAGCFPLQQRDHLPGFCAALLRQRQLRAGARQGARDDRLPALPRRGAAAAARAGPPCRHRHRLLRRGHRHRPL